MELQEVLKIIEKLEMFRFELVYTSEQIEKDKITLEKLKKQLLIQRVSQTLNSSFKKGDKVITYGLNKATVTEVNVQTYEVIDEDEWTWTICENYLELAT